MDRATDDDSSGDESEMIMACKICLETEGKLQRITSREVRDAYRNLTGIPWDTSDRLPQHMCGECGARLRGTAGLRRKALSSLSLLDEILEVEPFVTSRLIRLKDRSSLKSNLRTKHFTPNEYVVGVSTKCEKQTNTDPDDYVEMRESRQDSAKTNGNLDPIQNIEHDNSTDNSSTTGNSKLEHVTEKETRSAIDASDNGSLEIVAVNSAVPKTQGYESDDSEEGILVIDLEETLETVLSSEYVGSSDGGMPIDELIDIYNNNGDGDGRLQELNERLGGEGSLQIDQSWGVTSDAGGRIRLREVRAAPEPCLGTLSGAETSNRIITQNYMNSAYKRLNPEFFTFIRVSEMEQIAEVTMRQYTQQFMDAALKCFVCFRNFRSRLTYDAHMQRHNPARGVFVCSVCKVRYKSPSFLQRHVHNNHAVKIMCNLCNFFTMSRSVAIDHEKFHEGVIYPCIYCPSSFNNHSTYKSHLRRRHLQASVCAFCGSTFLSKNGLLMHRYRMHPDADQMPLQGPHCGPCDVRFASCNAYSRHFSLSARHGPYYPTEASSAVNPREARN